MRTPPASTYRLQIRAGFDLDAAAEVVPYLRELGVGWAYLSPILQAAEGSDHGYDVVDPARVDDARGGPDGFARFVAAARAAGLGVLVDIVPNHVGVADPAQNPWWGDVLRLGQASPHAAAFDIDWAAGGGRVRLPILGAELDEVLAGGEITIDRDAGVAWYFDHALPLAPGSADGADPDDVRAVLARQHWELQHWRRGDAELNYRRFFTVTSLAGVRVEVPEVFAAAHVEIARWLREGLVDGLRIDHPDGLADPAGYLARLADLFVIGEPLDAPAAQAPGDRYVVVEKILEHGEELPGWWATDGTTGYDAMAEIDRVLVDPDGEQPLDELDARLRAESAMPQAAPYADLVHAAKRAVADSALQSEVRRLVRLLPAELRAGGERADRPGSVSGTAQQRGSDAEWSDALAELLASFPVYRAYLPAGAEHLAHAGREAIRRRPELTGAVRALVRLLQEDPGGEFTRRFMQTTGPVMAKGVEDTTFYRYTRLTSLAEVGGDPSVFSLDVPGLHAAFARRQAAWPRALTALSTHDTKRSGDVRARLAVLAELPERWAEVLDRLRAIASTGHGPFDNLLWQAIVGVWPVAAGDGAGRPASDGPRRGGEPLGDAGAADAADAEGAADVAGAADATDAELRERLTAYGIKAAREAKERTGWEDPDAEFEARVHAVVDAALGEARGLVAAFAAEIAPHGWSNALSAALLHLAGPGVPDVYQGTELWDLSLVDPDNRRAVDFAARRALLARLDGGWMPQLDATGAAKLLLTSRALRLRRDRAELFARYRALPVVGPASRHAVAFDRGGVIAVATRLPAGLARSGGWHDTAVLLPPGAWRDVLTGRTVPGGPASASTLLSAFPVALLTGSPP